VTWVEGGAPSAESKTIPKESQLMQTILKAGRAIGACGTFAVFEIIMIYSKLKGGRQAEYDRRTASTVNPDVGQCPVR
jgi:hypothetical protein